MKVDIAYSIVARCVIVFINKSMDNQFVHITLAAIVMLLLKQQGITHFVTIIVGV
jgi:hypothetical protein